MNSRKIATAAAGLALAGALSLVFPGTGSAESMSGRSVAAPAMGRVNFVPSGGVACGASVSGWASCYHHCTADGQSVEVLARFVLVGNTIACVGPDQAVKVSVAVIYSMDWNGRTCNTPGTTYPA
jgi:hypothetical protein